MVKFIRIHPTIYLNADLIKDIWFAPDDTGETFIYYTTLSGEKDEIEQISCTDLDLSRNLTENDFHDFVERLNK